MSLNRNKRRLKSQNLAHLNFLLWLYTSTAIKKGAHSCSAINWCTYYSGSMWNCYNRFSFFYKLTVTSCSRSLSLSPSLSYNFFLPPSFSPYYLMSPLIMNPNPKSLTSPSIWGTLILIQCLISSFSQPTNPNPCYLPPPLFRFTSATAVSIWVR